jgi:aminoglycoside phosphotransferase (APT) family kinase protein
MESISKIPITPEAVQAITEVHLSAHGKLRGYEELKDGMYNTAFLLELEDGFRCVVKAAPPDHIRVLRYEIDIMRAEVESMRLVRANTSVPVPEVYAYDTSRRFLESDYYLMEYVPGTAFHKLRPDLTAEEQANIQREMGRMAREINHLTNPAFGYFARSEMPGVTWRECFAHMLHDILQDGNEMDVALPMPYADLFALLEKHFASLDEITTPRLVHWDLWDGNVFVDPLTRKVTGLIDFERSLWGDPLIEVFFMDMDPEGACSQGYDADMLSRPAQKTRRLLYNAYLFLIMIIECYYRHYPTDDQEKWVRVELDKVLAALA